MRTPKVWAKKLRAEASHLNPDPKFDQEASAEKTNQETQTEP